MTTVTGYVPYEILRWDYLQQHKPRYAEHRVLAMTEQTKALLRRRVTDPTYTASALRAEAIGRNYHYDDLPCLEERANVLRRASLSIDTPEGLLVASGPTAAEWAAERAALERAYQEKVEEAIGEALRLAPSFRTLSVPVMIEHFIREPDRRIWRAITSLVPAEIRRHVYLEGRSIMEQEEEEEKAERERRAYDQG